MQARLQRSEASNGDWHKAAFGPLAAQAVCLGAQNAVMTHIWLSQVMKQF